MPKGFLASFSAAFLLTVSCPALAGETTTCARADERPIIGNAVLSDLDDLLDRPVVSQDGQQVGTVEDVVLDQCDDPKEIVIARPTGADEEHEAFAISPKQARFKEGSDAVTLQELTAAEVHALPNYQYDDAFVSLNRDMAPSAPPAPSLKQ